MADYSVGVTVDISDLSTDTNSTYGLDTGVFYWVTGRPGYSGSGYSGDAPASKTWKQGFLNSVSPSVDIIDTEITGNYATLSGLKFDLLNVGQFFNAIDTNEWSLLGKPVTAYIFLDDVSYYSWSGVVSNTNYNETKYTVTCRGNIDTKHKSFPPQSVTETLFPFVDDNVKGDIIPVCFGDINKAKCLPVYTEYKPLDLAIFYGDNYKLAPLSFFSELTKEIVLYTGGSVISENQYKGYVLRASVGGNNQTATIESNSISGSTGAVNNRRTSFIISKWFDTPPDNTNQISSDGDSPSIWYFEIAKYQSNCIVSNDPIESFYESDRGDPIDAAYWDDSEKKYVPLSHKALDYSTSDIRSTNFPGISLNSRGTDIDSDFFDKFTLTATDITPINPIGSISNPNYFFGSQTYTDITLNGDNPNLHDRDYITTNRINSIGGTPVNVLNYSIYFDCSIPSDFLERDYDEAYLLFDGSMESSTNQLFEIEVGYQLIDSRGRETEELNTTTIFSDTLVAATVQDVDYIPKQYYNESPDDELFNTYRESLDLGEYISNSKTLSAYKKIRIRVKTFSSVGFTDSDTFEFKFKEIAFVGVDSVDLKNEPVFTKVSGEQKEGTKTNTLEYASKSILETYDGISSSDIDYTKITNTFKIGRQILNQKNSREYLIELAKHTFTGIFWDKSGTLNISNYLDDTTSVITFDESNIIKGSITQYRDTSPDKVYNDFTLNYDWDEGRGKFNKTIGITNVDQSSFPGITESTGTNTDRSTYFSNVKVLSEGSDGIWYGELQYSDSIPWATPGTTFSWDGGSGDVILFAEITSLGESTEGCKFKFQNTNGISIGTYTGLDSIYQNGTSIQKWKTYAIGIADYSTGNAWWDICHNSYLRTLKVNKLPKEYSDLYWYPDNNNFVSGTGGAGDAAFNYLKLLVERVTIPKKYTEFNIPVSSTHLQLELLNPITFNDSFYTNSTDFTGWMQKIRTNYEDQTLTIGCLLNPVGIESDDTIIETTTAATIYTETTSASTIITEGA